MLFVLAAGLALLLETAGPFAAIAIVTVRARPRARAGTWAAGLTAVPIGAVLFLVTMLGKDVLRALAGGAEREAGTDAGMFFGHVLTAGLFAGVTEEVVRFGAAAAMFRRAVGRPLLAGALFGLGWGGIECAIVAVRHVSQVIFTARLYGDVAAIPQPWAPLLVTLERGGALALHVALAAFAVAAATALARGRAGRALALFGAAIALHALLDAWVRAGFLLFASKLSMGGPDIVIGTLVTEVGFLAGGLLALAAASRLRGPAPSPE